MRLFSIRVSRRYLRPGDQGPGCGRRDLRLLRAAAAIDGGPGAGSRSMHTIGQVGVWRLIRDAEALAQGIVSGQRRALARAITLSESSRADHRAKALRLLEQLCPAHGRLHSPGHVRSPGVGKSTFIEVFGLHAISQGHRVAVLAVDPSSAVSGGSILGDKTRMEVAVAPARRFHTALPFWRGARGRGPAHA